MVYRHPYLIHATMTRPFLHRAATLQSRRKNGRDSDNTLRATARMDDEEILLDNLQPIAGTSCATIDQVIESQIRNQPSKANFFSNYRFASVSQTCVLLLSVCCAIVAGAAMPLVSVVFGELASEFVNEDGQASGDVRGRTRHLTLLLVYIGVCACGFTGRCCPLKHEVY